MARVEQAGNRDPEHYPSMRVLVEGGMQDDWYTHHTLFLEREIPPDCTQIRILRYNLSLIGRWQGPEIILGEDVPTDGSEIKFPNDGEVWGTEDEGKMHRPTTIITEDGRIFHDLSLLPSRRLSHFLETMSEEKRKKLFEGKELPTKRSNGRHEGLN